jgi:hypothetical protein
MVFSTCFNGYDAGIMTVILADKQFIEYYNIDDNRSGLVATIPWAMTGNIELSGYFRLTTRRLTGDFS